MSPILLIVFVAGLNSVTPIPQIFTDTYTTCEFTYKANNKKLKKIIFPDKLWTIDTRDFTVHFSVCNTPQPLCRNQSSTCIIQKSDNKVLNFNPTFTLSGSHDSLISEGPECGPDKKYSLMISLLCSDSVKPKPRLIPPADDEDCNFEVLMRHPQCSTKCTETLQNFYVLDVRKIAKNILIESGPQTFSLSLCGGNTGCDGGVSVCEVLKGGRTVPLALIDSQHIVYDAGKNKLTARGRYKDGGIVKDVQVLISCNWETELANATFQKAQNQSRHYKFALESSFGCIKLPHKCQVSSIDNLNYDLSRLYNINGWQVSGVPTGKMSLNICGGLKMGKNLCSNQYSQVCHYNNNKFINRGSILRPLEAFENFLRATFVSGSTCEENPHLLYSTEIEFRCSKAEKGPKFKETRNCTTFLLWETPQACPLDYYKGENCYINDRISNRDLRHLYLPKDKIYSLTPNNKTQLIYNLCGPLHVTCNNFTNTSFCLKHDGGEIVIGWDNRDVISEKGRLKMELSGSSCSNNKQSHVTIDFICNYQDPPPPALVRVIEDNCKYNLTIFTPNACAAQNNFENCVYHVGNATYDLRPLVLKNRNYLVQNGDFEFTFNLCGPIINGPRALCGGVTGFCRRNKTEVNVQKQFTSVGGIGKPRLLNNSLIVEAPIGALCADFNYYKSVIHFECAQNAAEPIFLSEESCAYNFLWKRPEACPKARQCIMNGSTRDVTFNLTNLESKILKIKVDNETEYTFHWCEDVYKKSSNSQENTHFLNRLLINHEIPLVLFDLKQNCDKNNTVSKIFFKFDCSEENDYQRDSFENCVLNMTVRTSIVCPIKNVLSVPYEFVPSTEKNKYSTSVNCSIVNGNTGYEFNLNKLKSEKIKEFQLNFDESLSDCDGIFCKNSVQIVPKMCPVVSFDYSSQITKLHYLTPTRCGKNGVHQLDILLKCNKTDHHRQILEEKDCKSVVLYNLQEACSLLEQEIVSATPSSAIIWGVTGPLILLFFVGIIYFYLYKRRCECYYSHIPIPCHLGKRSVPVYYRDAMI